MTLAAVPPPVAGGDRPRTGQPIGRPRRCFPSLADGNSRRARDARNRSARSDVDGDRRGVTLSITKAGQAAYDDATDAAVATLDEVLSAADAKTRANIVDGLVALRALLQARAAARVGS